MLNKFRVIREIKNLNSDAIELNNEIDLNKSDDNIFKSIIVMLGIL